MEAARYHGRGRRAKRTAKAPGFNYTFRTNRKEDLNEQALLWLEGTANVRRHGATGERPVVRFERDEQQALLPLASCPYRRLGIHTLSQPARRPLPITVDVERRSLSAYAEAVS